MPITYNNKRVVPCPIVNISKSYKRLGNTQKVKPIYTLTIDGKILANMGSPINDDGTELNLTFQTSGGVFDYPGDSTGWNIREHGQHMVMMKQQALRALFSEDYKQLEIIPWGGQAPIRCYPRVVDIKFPAGLWYKICDYSITLETEFLIGASLDESPNEDVFSADSGNIGSGQTFEFVSQYNLEDANDTTSIEMDTENFGIFKVTRNVSAKGYRSVDSIGNIVAEGWQNARTWVRDRGGYNPVYAQSGMFGNISGGFTNYNHYRTENIDVYNGTYAMTENWLLASGNYYEDYSAETKNSATDPYQTITVQGTINGLSNFVVGTDSWVPASGLIKYNAASGAWFGTVSGTMYTRAQNYLGVPLNPLPVSQVVTHNFTKGVITYNTEFNTRPLNFVSGAISETLSVIDSNPSGLATIIASHIVLNRSEGPVLQNIYASPETSRSISYECVLRGPQYPSGNDISYLMALKPRNQVEQLFSGLVPTSYATGYLFLVQDDENWNPLQLRYSLNRKYIYERQ